LTVLEINMGSISRTWESEAWKNGNLCRYAVRQMLFILVANMFVVPLFGCVKKSPVSTDNTAVPSSPEECMPDNGMDAFDAVIKVLGKAWNN